MLRLLSVRIRNLMQLRLIRRLIASSLLAKSTDWLNEQLTLQLDELMETQLKLDERLAAIH